MDIFKSILTPNEITDFTSDIGVSKANFSPWRTRLLSIMAGLFIAIGGATSTKANIVLAGSKYASLTSSILFTIGLILVLVAGAELFTGNILLIVAFCDKKLSAKELIVNWARVYLWNFIGAFFFAILIFLAFGKDDPVIKAAANMLETKTSYSFIQCISLAFLCNLLVCLAVWMSFGAKQVSSKIMASAFPILVFVFMKFEHIVANFYYYTEGILGGTKVGISSIILNSLIPVTIGNMLGGLFVGLMYYLSYHKN